MDDENKVVSIGKGLEIVKSDGRAVNGGKRKGAGRKSRDVALTNYARGIRMLDDSVEYAIETMVKGLSDTDPGVRYKSAEFLINKSLLTKKDGKGEEGGTKLTKEAMEEAITEVIAMINAG